jgi:hypothetical protein
MAESAKVLAPGKIVPTSDLDAGCSLPENLLCGRRCSKAAATLQRAAATAVAHRWSGRSTNLPAARVADLRDLRDRNVMRTA